MTVIKNKSILIVTYEFPPIIGGAGVYAHDLAIGFSMNQCNVDVVTYKHEEESKGVKNYLKTKYNINVFDFIPIFMFHFIQFAWLVKKRTSEKNYDLIILSDARSKRIFALFRSIFKAEIRKSISIFHGNEVNSFFKTPSIIVKVLFLSRKFLRLFSDQKFLITVSENEKRIWEEFLPQFKTKILLTTHGINEDVFYPRTQAEISSLKIALGIPLNKRILLSASRLVKLKGQDILLEAFANILHNEHDAHLLIVGNGNYIDALKANVQRLKIESAVSFVGTVNREILSKYYSVSEIFILTSRFEEAFGLVYIEAAACGVPSISGNRGGVADAVVDGETGYIVDSTSINDLENRMRFLLSNEEIRKSLGNNAYLRFKKNLTCSKMASNLIRNLNI